MAKKNQERVEQIHPEAAMFSHRWRYDKCVMEHTVLRILVLYRISIVCMTYMYIHIYLHICGNALDIAEPIREENHHSILP